MKSFNHRCVAATLLTVAWLSSNGVHAAETNIRGAQVYNDACLRCHGKSGEGVHGKYNDALFGDWSIQKLTRYIAKNMPEDDPGTVTVADAEAVSRYISDKFYSRAARFRNNPARVELVRLTNRQYVNTVADLVKSFGANDPVIGQERGLSGNYRQGGRRGGEERKTIERVDRQVNFDFSDASPFTNYIGFKTNITERTTNANGKITAAKTNVMKLTNEFSMNWRGSLIADESGDYEFIMKTPNGARLWVNDDETPLIDASVASGDMTEHRASLRLIGGRAYPLRLECNKAAKDKTGAVALHWHPPHGVQQIIPARNLTRARTTPTFVVATSFPADDSSVGYERGVSISKAWDEATTHAAISVANYAVRNLDRLAGTKGNATNRAAKVESFCAEFVSLAFRRPLTDEEKQIYVTSQFKAVARAKDGTARAEEAVKRVVLLALKSPRFLYIGLDNAQPDDYAVASRLSLGLWDSAPDAELRKLATKKGLRTREQIAGQSRRMLADPRARAKMQVFFHHWLQVDRVDNVEKDSKLFPGFTPEIIADLRTSLNLFVDDVVWSSSSDYRRLLTENDLWVNERLAKFYGVKADTDHDFVKVNLNAKERSGVITHPYLLAAFSYQRSTSPIHRGVFLTRNIVGRALKSPPIAVAFDDAEFSPNLTMRQKVEQLTQPDSCQACHSVINPLGFSLEHYDAVGRFRTKDGDKPVNAETTYVLDDGTKIRLTGAPDVAAFATNNERAQSAFVEQLFHAVVKQPVLAYGIDAHERLRKSFVESGFNIQKLLVDIAVLSSLHGLPEPDVAKN
ncbi:MAG TPA: DUF1592 domain-containing protein [Candidatus Acidoferrum sp.]|nr:DUF1592 domain-containing protein [Candidatus Acidoferrum sp.]